MASATWNTSVRNGDWNVGSNWKSGTVPGIGAAGTDVAILPAKIGTSYTVTVGAADPVIDVARLGVLAPANNTTRLNVNGILNTGTLQFGGPAGKARVDIDIGGTLAVRSSLVANNAETVNIAANGSGGVASGGHLVLGSATSSFSNITRSGGPVTFSFNNNGVDILNTGVIEFAGPSFTFGSVSNFNIANVQRGDQLDVDHADLTGDTFAYSGSTLQVLQDGTVEFQINNLSGAGLTSASFALPDQDTITVVCYARGTMIATPGGEVPVETLRAGSSVITQEGAGQVAQTVRWVGHRQIELDTHPRPETVAPIRIRRHAFAEAMPRRDLLVSPDHAVVFDGMLICARQLVNGSTIRQETTCRSVDYFHVELERHAILLAEGLPAESYVDTGNRGFFAMSSIMRMLHPDPDNAADRPAREAASCLPLVCDAARVLPVWQRLVDRAVALGEPPVAPVTTTDSRLRLLARGRSIVPAHNDGRVVTFPLPAGTSEVRLLSRAQSPTEARPWLEDCRRLGVRVARVVLRAPDDIREVPMDHPELTHGWWEVERSGEGPCRWTDGDALLPLTRLPYAALLDIHLSGTMIFVVEPHVAPARRRSSPRDIPRADRRVVARARAD